MKINEDLQLQYLTQLRQRNYSPQTLRAYRQDLSHFFVFLQDEECAISDIDLNLARKYLVRLKENDLSARSVRRHVSTVKSFCRFLEYHHIIGVNPFTLLRTPKVSHRLPNCLIYQDLIHIMESCKDDYLGQRDRAILEFLYSTGVRAFELTKINLSHVERRVITIEGKRRKHRLLFIGPPAWKALQNYLPLREEHVDKNDPDGLQALFLNDKGRRLTTRGLYYIVKKYEKCLPYGKKIGVHLFRHTFATHLLNEGADLRTVQEMLGHQNLSTTQIYTHVGIEHLKQIYHRAHPHAKRLK